MPWERNNIRSLDAYVPGEQPTAAQTAAGTVIKLNTNENAYPPSPAVMNAVRGVTAEALRLYPPADAAPFRAAAAALHGVSPQQVIATNGGDELLRLLVTVCCLPSRNDAQSDAQPGGLGMTDPSYTLYQVLAGIHDTPVTTVSRGDAADGSFPLPADYAQQLNTAGCRLAFLVNPHAPSGMIESIDTLRTLADAFDGVLVIDEAYADFAPDGEALGMQLVREGVDNGRHGQGPRQLQPRRPGPGRRHRGAARPSLRHGPLDPDPHRACPPHRCAAAARLCHARQPHQLRAGPRAGRRRPC